MATKLAKIPTLFKFYVGMFQLYPGFRTRRYYDSPAALGSRSAGKRSTTRSTQDPTKEDKSKLGRGSRKRG